MKNTKKILAALVLVLSSIFVQGQKCSDTKLKEVLVYFHFIGTEGTESKILPLKRKVSAAAPLRPAIEELLKEPTDSEQKAGYKSAGYDNMKLVSVKIFDGEARIDFSRELEENRSDYNPGDLLTLSFESAVIKTAKQFPSVKKVIVCVNQMNEFGIGLVIDAPIPCPKNK